MNFACVLLSFNRPNYLRQTITSLERNRPADWFFLQDGAIRQDGKKMAEEEDIQRSLTILRDSPLEGEIIYHGENVGVTWQFKKAFELFEGYDALLIFEDDMIVSKDYIFLTLEAAKQFPNALISLGHSNWYKRYPDAPLNALIRGRAQLWGYWFPKVQWEATRDRFQEWAEIVGKEHGKRPKKKLMNHFQITNAAVDNFIGKYLWFQGWPRLQSVWPRGKYIGKKGLHMNPEKFDKKYGDLTRWEYNEGRNFRWQVLNEPVEEQDEMIWR